MKKIRSGLTHVKNVLVRRKKLVLLTSGITTLTVVFFAGGVFAYANVYEGKIYPNVMIGSVAVGGLTSAEATEKLQAEYNRMLDDGWSVSIDDRLEFIDLRASGSTDPDLVYDLIDFTPDGIVADAMQLGRYGNELENYFLGLLVPIQGPALDPPVTLLEVPLTDALRNAFEDLETEAEPTTYEISSTDDDELEIEVAEGTIGRQIDIKTALALLQEDAKDFHLSTISTEIIDVDEIISKEEAEALFKDIEDARDTAPYVLNYTSENQRTYSWKITGEDLLDWLLPVQDEDEIVLGLDLQKMDELLTKIHHDVDIEPVNARFKIEGNRVVEFAGSMDGVAFDEKATMSALASQLGDEDIKLAITVVIAEPEIPTEDVNDLGIKEIIGVGISNFGGSPANRVSNIKHGAAKLNGILIAPGEEMSLVQALKPFTVADGWLPELVIKGDEIKPEIGGGACQFGTTLFRATMNSGLKCDATMDATRGSGWYSWVSTVMPRVETIFMGSSVSPFMMTN
ncbi:VanW family protein [Patescibacteria group bacterium]|nr:VanW family protein [Patescibacteria group bacterium]